MADPRLAAALARIDTAATRLEGLALAVPAAAPDATLAERHRLLRQSAAAAIARIDRLIGEAA